MSSTMLIRQKRRGRFGMKGLGKLVAVSMMVTALFSLTACGDPDEGAVVVNMAIGTLEEEPLQILDEELTTVLGDMTDEQGNPVEVKVYSYMPRVEKLFVQFGAAEGDVFVLSHDMYVDFAQQGGFIDIGDHVAENWAVEDIDEFKVAAYEQSTEPGETPDKKDPELYGVPIQDGALFKKTGLQAKEPLIAAIPVYSPDQEAAIKIIDKLAQK